MGDLLHIQTCRSMGGPVLHALRACELAPSVLRCSPGFPNYVINAQIKTNKPCWSSQQGQ